MKTDSLVLKACAEIRKKILSQQLVANIRLKEVDWASKIGVSRIDIRKAFRRGPCSRKRCYVVRPFTVADIQLIRELREILERGQ